MMSSEYEGKISIEDLFSSRGRVKVLKELAAEGELLISDLCRRISLNHSTTNSHLKVLVKSGLIEKKILGSSGRIKSYRYRTEDLRARALKNFFELWHS